MSAPKSNLPQAILDLVDEVEIPEFETLQVVYLEALERIWPSLQAAQMELISVARRTADRHAFVGGKLAEDAQAALKRCGELWP